MINDKVSTIMSKELISIEANDHISSFETYFKTRNIHHIIVTNSNSQIEGIISKEDVLRNKSFLVEDKLYARNLMTLNPHTIDTHCSISDAVDIFLQNNYRALPVVDDTNKPIGIITPYDILGRIKKQTV